MLLGGLQKNSLIDYPGKICCTVFTIGCNFRCPFCYSGELVLEERIKENKYQIFEKDFFDFLEQRRGLLEACVICGGEPTIHKDLIDFATKIKKMGFLVKLDSNGSNPNMWKELLEKNLIDFVAMDVKATKEKYGFYSGNKADIKKIEESVEILKNSKIDFEFRTTVAPGIEERDLIEIGNWIQGKNVNYSLQEFNNQKEILDKEILKLPILDAKTLEKIVEKLKPKFQSCKLR
ncbi:MAG: anaerobic ribonucleoside-triphosphate reductase activating protein [Patescibacteria group bacterium]|nr:anaerobic ribonucleoside-triphosphate reductase activating protein [Patescibacteria group bacterium]